MCEIVCVSVCVCPRTSTRLIQTPEKQTPAFTVSLALRSLAAPPGFCPLMHRPENIPLSIWARQRWTACAPINALTLHVCSWPFNLSGEPQRRTGVWLFISLAARISCLPLHGGRRGRRATTGLGPGETEKGPESIQNHFPNANPAGEIRAPSPRQKPNSASLYVILFLHPGLLAEKGKMSPGAETPSLMHTASSLMTKQRDGIPEIDLPFAS